MIEFKYRPDVDGLRALAVILVLLFHADLGVPGGYIGVDVFFVISGFLITGLILKEQQAGNFSLKQFWIRRIRRILPAAMFVVMVTLVFGFFILLPLDYIGLAKSAIYQQAMLANVYFWRSSGYFTGNAIEKPLLHTWSLAVEEQFYIGYPFLLVFLSRFSSRVMIYTIFILTVFSFLLCEWGVRINAGATFFLLPTRAWELLLGGTIWFLPFSTRIGKIGSNLIGFFGMLAIIVSAFLYNSNTRFPGISALLPCLGALFLIYSNTNALNAPGRMLSSIPVVYIGLLSYSLYLWHWPILSFMTIVNDGNVLGIFARVNALVLSLFISIGSLYFIESPFRNKLVFSKNLSFFKLAIISSVVVVAASALIIMSIGFPGRYDPLFISYANAKASVSFVSNLNATKVIRNNVPTFGNIGGGRIKCLVWGDSHAMALISGIDAACKSRDIWGFQATHSSTPPILDFVFFETWGLNEEAPAFNSAVVDFVKKNNIQIVILSAKWSFYQENKEFKDKLRKTVKILNDANVKVAIVLDVAKQKGDIPAVLSGAVKNGLDPEKIGVSFHEYLNENKIPNDLIKEVCDKSAVVLDPSAYFVDKFGIWRAEFDGVSMYRDSHHLSVEGSLRLKPMFDQFFDYLGIK